MNGYVVSVILIILGLVVVIGAYWYDQNHGHAEEYGPLSVGLLGLVVIVVGIIVAIGTALVRAAT